MFQGMLPLQALGIQVLDSFALAPSKSKTFARAFLRLESSHILRVTLLPDGKERRSALGTSIRVPRSARARSFQRKSFAGNAG
jgi:hypothetical protein